MIWKQRSSSYSECMGFHVLQKANQSPFFSPRSPTCQPSTCSDIQCDVTVMAMAMITPGSEKGRKILEEAMEPHSLQVQLHFQLAD
ncbi:hypothetical protein F0562_011516 [Nyssa sinensis]|uniref:Uncharacterized protein n=1 Tax=Nyssa sinensis TaxID=561372 RepID=A0A5J4ZPN0_9ASTE|nr:hypothetical protein F0562_011516 [Nyssa sinensis]